MRYTEHTIINSLQSLSCFNYKSTQNAQHSNFKLSKASDLITYENPINHVYRDILNINHHRLFNQSTIFTYIQFEIYNNQLSHRNIINQIYGRKSHNSTNCRDIAIINITNCNSISIYVIIINRNVLYKSNWNEMKCVLQPLLLPSNAQQTCMCQRNWIVIAVVINSSRIEDKRNLFHHQMSKSKINEFQCFDYELWINWLRIITKIEMKEATTTYIQSKFTDSQSYRWYKRTRIFVTPRVVEFSMKSNTPETITITYHNHAEDHNRHNLIKNATKMPRNAMKCHVIINLSADILTRGLLT